MGLLVVARIGSERWFTFTNPESTTNLMPSIVTLALTDVRHDERSVEGWEC